MDATNIASNLYTSTVIVLILVMYEILLKIKKTSKVSIMYLSFNAFTRNHVFPLYLVSRQCDRVDHQVSWGDDSRTLN